MWSLEENKKSSKKFEEKSERRILVGYEDNKSYRLLDPQAGKIEYSSVIFNERKTKTANYVFWEDTNEDYRTDLQTTNDQTTYDDEEVSGEIAKETPKKPPLSIDVEEKDGRNYLFLWKPEKRKLITLTWFHLAFWYRANHSKRGTHLTRIQNEWKEAINEEMTSLLENQTWILVPWPLNRKIVDYRWIFKKKEKIGEP